MPRLRRTPRRGPPLPRLQPLRPPHRHRRRMPRTRGHHHHHRAPGGRRRGLPALRPRLLAHRRDPRRSPRGQGARPHRGQKPKLGPRQVKLARQMCDERDDATNAATPCNRSPTNWTSPAPPSTATSPRRLPRPGPPSTDSPTPRPRPADRALSTDISSVLTTTSLRWHRFRAASAVTLMRTESRISFVAAAGRACRCCFICWESSATGWA